MFAQAPSGSRSHGSVTSSFLYVPDGSSSGSEVGFVTLTVPTILTPGANETAPFTVNLTQRRSDGTPDGVSASSCGRGGGSARERADARRGGLSQE